MPPFPATHLGLIVAVPSRSETQSCAAGKIRQMIRAAKRLAA
jgi:hypothetical protein